MCSNCFSLVDFSTSENVNNETILPRQHFPKYDIFRIVPSKFVDKKCPLSNAVLSTLGWLLFIFQNVDISRNVCTCILTQVDSYTQYITQKKELFDSLQWEHQSQLNCEISHPKLSTQFLEEIVSSLLSMYVCTYIPMTEITCLSVISLVPSLLCKVFAGSLTPKSKNVQTQTSIPRVRFLIKQIILC